MAASKAWLIHNRDKAEVPKHWDITYPIREKGAQKKKHATVQDVFAKWPILTESESYNLVSYFSFVFCNCSSPESAKGIFFQIEADFNQKFVTPENPFVSSALLLKWEAVFEGLLKLYGSKIKDTGDLLDVELLGVVGDQIPSAG